jgi:hypothetical protein
MCHIKYHDQLTIQEHVFSGTHIAKVRLLIESSASSKNDNDLDTDAAEPVDFDPYNKFLLKNHMFNQLMAIGKPDNLSMDEPRAHSNLENGGSNPKKDNNNSLFIENNIMLHINAADDIPAATNKTNNTSNGTSDNDAGANNKELMHQLYNFGQMGGELIK